MKCYMVEMEIDYEASVVKGVFSSLEEAVKCYDEELSRLPDHDSESMRLDEWEGTESKEILHSCFKPEARQLIDL